MAVRNAASRAFVWLGETLGEQAIKPFMDNLSRQHLLKIKEVKEITFFKKETPSRPATGNVESTNSSSRPNTASSESAVPSPLSSSYGTPSRPSTGEPVRPSTGDIARPPTSSSKPVPRPGVVRVSFFILFIIHHYHYYQCLDHCLFKHQALINLISNIRASRYSLFQLIELLQYANHQQVLIILFLYLTLFIYHYSDYFDGDFQASVSVCISLLYEQSSD